ncbi:hypothetical protein MXD81_14065, partial [Microbacteriaceae bacterium K1510]|nr:hypothetical protein [Microbacteriaceae bacterium K1510]
MIWPLTDGKGLITLRLKQRDETPPDEAARACDENAHRLFLRRGQALAPLVDLPQSEVAHRALFGMLIVVQ